MVELSCETLRKTSADDSGVSGLGSTIGALIIRIGFGTHYAIITIRNPKNSMGNYLGLHIILDSL